METIGAYTNADDALAVLTAAGADSRPVVVRDKDAAAEVASLRTTTGSMADVVLDTAGWRGHCATIDEPTTLSAPDSFVTVSVDQWAPGVLSSLSGTVALTPSRFVATDAWQPLKSLIADLTRVTHPRVVPFVPADGAMIGAHRVDKFLQMLAPLEGTKVAFLFASKSTPPRTRPRLHGLRRVLAAHPGSWLIGVEPVVALDAVARGAERAFVGVRSSYRFPTPPGQRGGGGNAADFVPGLLHADLLEMRSPRIYAEWYMTKSAPVCSLCRRAVDAYSSSDSSKAAILTHNLHAMSRLSEDMHVAASGPSLERAAHDQRTRALVKHLDLEPRVPLTEADAGLRNLVRLDAACLGMPAELEGRL